MEKKKLQKEKAKEKAAEIKLKTDEEFQIEKLRMLEAEKTKIRAEYERKEKQVEVQRRMYVLGSARTAQGDQHSLPRRARPTTPGGARCLTLPSSLACSRALAGLRARALSPSCLSRPCRRSQWAVKRGAVLAPQVPEVAR